MPNRTVNHNNRNRAAYQVDGNTVRRMEAMPDYRKERRDRQEREREEELRKRRRAAARNQEKALRPFRRVNLCSKRSKPLNACTFLSINKRNGLQNFFKYYISVAVFSQGKADSCTCG